MSARAFQRVFTCEILEKKQQKIQQFLTKILRFDSKAVHGFQKRCKGVYCVDLGESFPTSIYLLNLASIQQRTNPVKILTFQLF